MINVHFNKTIAQAMQRAIHDGKPIEVPLGGWTQINLFMLAGLLDCEIFSRGRNPVHGDGLEYQRAPSNDEQLEALVADMSKGDFARDMEAAIGFISGLFCEISADHYDKKYENELAAICSWGKGGKLRKKIIKGRKQS